MDVTYDDNSITISGLAHFDLKQCLGCGQAFRWKETNGGYASALFGCEIIARQDGGTLTLAGVNQTDGTALLRYFDLERDYGAVKASYAHDVYLSEGMQYAGGIRVLRQPVFETLISFIISANNNVKRITGIVDKLCTAFGQRVDTLCDFPTAQALAAASEADVRACGAGYRAKYIVEASQMAAAGFDFDALAGMPYEAARQALTALPGVGLKVADCVCLYALGFVQAFPMDTWMQKVLCGVYGYAGKTDKQMRAFVDEKFGENAGLAQQYLFHYARTSGADCRGDQ